MENKVMLDTDVLVGVLRGHREDTDLVKSIDTRIQLATTDINAFELYYGAYRSKNRKQSVETVEGLLGELKLMHTTEAAMRLAGGIAAALEKRGSPLDFKDILIASIVLDGGGSILTRNIKDFERINRLRIFTA